MVFVLSRSNSYFSSLWVEWFLQRGVIKGWWSLKLELCWILTKMKSQKYTEAPSYTWLPSLPCSSRKSAGVRMLHFFPTEGSCWLLCTECQSDWRTAGAQRHEQERTARAGEWCEEEGHRAVGFRFPALNCADAGDPFRRAWEWAVSLAASFLSPGCDCWCSLPCPDCWSGPQTTALVR